MQFKFHEDYLVFIKQREKLLKNGSYRNRKKDHVPVMRLFRKIDNTHICILLDKILPRNPDIAYGMAFMQGSFGRPIKVNIEQFVSDLDYKFDAGFFSKKKMSQHLAKSFQTFNYIDDDIYHVKYVEAQDQGYVVYDEDDGLSPEMG